MNNIIHWTGCNFNINHTFPINNKKYKIARENKSEKLNVFKVYDPLKLLKFTQTTGIIIDKFKFAQYFFRLTRAMF